MPRVTIIFAMEVHSGGIIQRFSSEPWKDLSSASWSSPSSPYAATAAESLQSCPTLCDPIDGSPPGSPVPGILQAGTLQWVATSFSNAWKWKVKVKSKSLSRVRLLATPWTAAYQAPPSMGFSRQECWSGVSLLIAWFFFHSSTRAGKKVREHSGPWRKRNAQGHVQ